MGSCKPGVGSSILPWGFFPYFLSSCKSSSFFSQQDELSLRYELSGGFIKNAILSALSIAVSRDGENPVICHKDLQQGANLQLRGALRMKVHVCAQLNLPCHGVHVAGATLMFLSLPTCISLSPSLPPYLPLSLSPSLHPSLPPSLPLLSPSPLSLPPPALRTSIAVCCPALV